MNAWVMKQDGLRLGHTWNEEADDWMAWVGIGGDKHWRGPSNPPGRDRIPDRIVPTGQGLAPSRRTKQQVTAHLGTTRNGRPPTVIVG